MFELFIVIVLGTISLTVAGVMIGVLALLIGFGQAAAIALLGGKP